MSSRQLQLAAPVIDRDTGLHAYTCPCARCEAGYRPTAQERKRAAAARLAAVERERERKKETERRTLAEARAAESLARGQRVIAEVESVKDARLPEGGFRAWLEEQRKGKGA